MTELRELAIGEVLGGCMVTRREDLPEIEGTAYVMSHELSGARVLYLQNEDENKSFSIAFRTPPQDDTGVFHILEHSVLCGSDRYPVKEPFVNLLKSSMQTFLNAMTFPDKTMYPVASTNEQDLLNLMDVYMDAVLHPAIYQKKAIFQQEGWHYELAGESAGADEGEGAKPELVHNGVVFNEMKGALSSPDSVLFDALSAALFPDTAYRFESGGTPEAIPTLTYEGYLDEHSRHYNLANSYIILYGNMDVERVLNFLDERYLSVDLDLHNAAKRGLEPRALELQAPVKNFGIRKEMVTAPENACCALGFAVGDVHDRTRLIAADILTDALAGSNEAPLKRALLDANLASDASAYVADGLLQPFLVIDLRDSNEGVLEQFQQLVIDTMEKICEEGIDQDLIEASLSHSEFIMREGDFGMSDGVALSMAAMAGWLYDDELATEYLKYEDTFAFLREKLNTGWWENLARELFLDNPHAVSVELVPVEAPEVSEEAQKLAAIAAEFGEDDFAKVADEVKTLRDLQEAPDTPEQLATLPTLSASDIGPAPERPEYHLVDGAPAQCLRHFMPTRGIAYAYHYFDLSCLTFDELPYATILAMTLSKLDTDQHTAAQIDVLTQSRLGNLSYFPEVFEDQADPTIVNPKFVVSASALEQNAADLAMLPTEILLRTDFSDVARIKDALIQKRVSMEQTFTQNGHSAAMSRIGSYYTQAGVVRQKMIGVEFYRFLKDLLANFDERAEQLSAKLRDVALRLFRNDNLLVSFTGSDQSYEAFWNTRNAITGTEAAAAAEGRLIIPEPIIKNEAFIVPTDVTYSGAGYDSRLLDAPAYQGSWALASRALSYDYLWNEVRVKGGAYGAGFQAVRGGALRFYSYRDPRIDETLQRFADSCTWLSTFDPSPEEWDGYIVSTVAGADRPQKARALARIQDQAFMTGIAPDDRLIMRDQLIHATREVIHEHAQTAADAVAKGARCVFGNKDIIARSAAEWDVIDLLNE